MAARAAVWELYVRRRVQNLLERRVADEEGEKKRHAYETVPCTCVVVLLCAVCRGAVYGVRCTYCSHTHVAVFLSFQVCTQAHKREDVGGCTSTTAVFGEEWEQVVFDKVTGSTKAPWAGRGAHAALVHNGAIWILGGKGGDKNDANFNPLYNDVWKTEDETGVRMRATPFTTSVEDRSSIRFTTCKSCILPSIIHIQCVWRDSHLLTFTLCYEMRHPWTLRPDT